MRQHDYRVTVRWNGDTGAGYRNYVRDHDVVVEGKPVLKGNGGRFTEVVLRPEVTVADPAMVERVEALHKQAHDTCFIANSVNFPVRHEPVTASS